MGSNSHSSDENSPPRSRQKPGSACEECRRRKLRCDRERPQCAVCAESGVECNISTSRPPRGPKRGHLKVLKTRIAALENRLVEQEKEISPGDQLMNMIEVPDSTNAEGAQPQNQQPTFHIFDSSEMGLSDGFMDTTEGMSLGPTPNTFISELMRADLDQSYFDRVHNFAPLLHRFRYFAWAGESTKTESRRCLQYAMWTIAASLSAQFQHIRHSLYRDTRQMLEALELKDNKMESIDIEQVQAWILLAIYEFMRTTYRRGWMSAGRAFRLVQLMRLYELDGPNNLSRQFNGLPQPDLIETEEKRRTFWIAYTLDRFISVCNEWPLTLIEQVISTRLPAPEQEFQSGKPVTMGFLSDLISTSDLTTLSPFNECIVLATLCGRIISHRQQSAVESIYGNVSQDFWDRHSWLDTILTQRIHILSADYPSATHHVDSMLLFTNMIAQTTVLHLYKILDSMSWEMDEFRFIYNEYEKKAIVAAGQISMLAKALSQLSNFKAHPFTPIPLFLCAEFFIRHPALPECTNQKLQGILEVLQDLKSVNNLAQNYLNLFELEGDEGSYLFSGAIDPSILSLE